MKQIKNNKDPIKFNQSSYDSSEDCDDAGSDQKKTDYQPMRQQLKQQYGILFTGLSPNKKNNNQGPGQILKNLGLKKIINLQIIKGKRNFQRKFCRSQDYNLESKLVNCLQIARRSISSIVGNIQEVFSKKQKLNQINESVNSLTFFNYTQKHQDGPQEILKNSLSNSLNSNKFVDLIEILPQKVLDECNRQLQHFCPPSPKEEQMEEAMDMIQGCRHSSKMLLNLLNDLLDLAKQEKQTFSLNKSYFDLTNTIKESFKTLEFLSLKKQVKLIFKMDPNQNKFFQNVYGDEKRYEQILLNFLSNALKFTPPQGQVEVILEANQVFSTQGKSSQLNQQQRKDENNKQEIMNVINEFYAQDKTESDEKIITPRSNYDLNFGSNYKKIGSSPRTPSVNFEINNKQNLLFIKFSIKVTDTGHGISQEGLKCLFLDFSSLPEHSHFNQRGTGLGLSICKKIINRMGGKVHVKSQIGIGTTFKIEITTLSQIQISEKQQESINSHSSNKSNNILNIDRYLDIKEQLLLQKNDQNHLKNSGRGSLNSHLSSKDDIKLIENKKQLNKKQIGQKVVHQIPIKMKESQESLTKSYDEEIKFNLQSQNIHQKSNKKFSITLEKTGKQFESNSNNKKSSIENTKQINQSIGNTIYGSVSSESQIEQISPIKVINQDSQVFLRNKQLYQKSTCEIPNLDQNFNSKDTGSFQKFDSDFNLLQNQKYGLRGQDEIQSVQNLSESSIGVDNHQEIDNQLQEFQNQNFTTKLDTQKQENQQDGSVQNQDSFKSVKNSISFGEIFSSPDLGSPFSHRNKPKKFSPQSLSPENSNLSSSESGVSDKKSIYINEKEDDIQTPEILKGNFEFEQSYETGIFEIQDQQKWIKDIKILLVNDEHMILMILERIFLSQIGISPANIEKAYDGIEGHKKATSNAYDLIIMDLNMPVMDGFTATKKIKDFYEKTDKQIFLTQHQKIYCPYIIALSGSSPDEQLIEMCHEAGFDDYFGQPLTVNDIFQKILAKMFYLHQIIVREHISQMEEDSDEVRVRKMPKVSGIKEILSKRFDVIKEEPNEDEDQSHCRKFLQV